MTHAQRRQLWLRASGLLFVGSVLGFWLWVEATPAPREAPPPGQALAIDKSDKAQSERKALIDAMIEKGLVRRVDPGRDGVARVTLRAPFFLLDEETRRRHIDVFYAYYFDGSSVNDTVILRDARHGNEVGQYNPYRGGLTMYK